MQALDIKDKNCTQCGIGSYCKNKCQVNLLEDTKRLMIITSYPDDYNESKDTVMQGDNYKVLHEIMNKAVNADPSQIHYSYLVKCNPKGKIPNSEDIKTCLKYLKAEIEFIKPKSIIILGGFSAKILLGIGEEEPLSEVRKKSYDLSFIDAQGQELTIPTKVTYSTSYVRNSPYNLKSFATDLYAAYVTAIDTEATEVPTKVKIITTIEEAVRVFEHCLITGICSWDFETNGIEHRAYGETLCATGLAISFQHGSGFFIPLEQYDSPIPQELRYAWTKQVLGLLVRYIIQNPIVTMVGQNLKYDLHVLSHYLGEINILCDYDDTMYLDFYIDSTRPHGLKEQVTRIYPNYGGYEDAIKKYKWDRIPLGMLATYACIDSDMTLRVKTRVEAELMLDISAYKCYKNNTIPAAKVTYKAEFNGLKVDTAYLQNSIDKVTSMVSECLSRIHSNTRLIRYEKFCRDLQNKMDIKKLEERLSVWKETHQPGTKTEERYRTQIQDLKLGRTTNYATFNPASSKQLGDFLYLPEGLGLPKPRNPKTKKTGGTGVEALNMLEDKTGFIDSLLEYRSLNKTLSTYLLGIQDKLDIHGYVHTDFKVTGTETGRLSSSNPNVQNMTNVYKQKYTSTKLAASFIKGMFVPPADCTIVQVDYSQAELRVIAYYAQCVYMLNAYNDNVDLHAQTAADVLGITLDGFYQLAKDDQKLHRYRAKAVNFGFIYGMSAESFRHYALNDYGITYTVQECIKIRTIYFEKRPELLVYHETYKLKAKKFGGVRTLFGTKRLLPDIKSQDNYKMSNAERQAINTPIQGTSGLMTVFAVSILSHRLQKETKFVNTVHDSIIYYIPNSILDSEIAVIKETCENLPLSIYFNRHFTEVGKHPVLMKVDIEISTTNWAELKEY